MIFTWMVASDDFTTTFFFFIFIIYYSTIMSKNNPCNVMMNSARGPMDTTDWRQNAEVNFNQHSDNHANRRHLQRNASSILAGIKQGLEPSQCAAPNRPFKTPVKWTIAPTPYHQIRTQQVYR